MFAILRACVYTNVCSILPYFMALIRMPLSACQRVKLLSVSRMVRCATFYAGGFLTTSGVTFPCLVIAYDHTIDTGAFV